MVHATTGTAVMIVQTNINIVGQLLCCLGPTRMFTARRADLFLLQRLSIRAWCSSISDHRFPWGKLWGAMEFLSTAPHETYYTKCSRGGKLMRHEEGEPLTQTFKHPILVSRLRNKLRKKCLTNLKDLIEYIYN